MKIHQDRRIGPEDVPEGVEPIEDYAFRIPPSMAERVANFTIWGPEHRDVALRFGDLTAEGIDGRFYCFTLLPFRPTPPSREAPGNGR